MNKYVRFFVTYFLGAFGVHKFIDKKIGMGILYLLTAGLFGIGWLVDSIIAFIGMFKKEEIPSVKQNTQVYYTVPNESANNTPDTIVKESFGARDIAQLKNEINDAQLTYHYFVNVSDINWDNANKFKDNNNNFTVLCDEEGNIQSSFGYIGKIQKNNIINMVSDWKKKEMPYIIEINNACEQDNELSVRFGFYRNNYEYFSNKEKLTLPLTAYSSFDSQIEIEALDKNKVLSIDDEGDKYTVWASDRIGNLNSKAKKIQETQGIDFIMFDHSETNDSDKSIPYVTIFFNKE